MEIIVGNYSGFCNGVKNAVNKTIDVLNNDTIYSVGEIVHNEEVIKNLKKQGLIVKNSIEDIPNNVNVIIRAHGEGIGFYRKAREKELNIIDLTCGRVKLIHNKISSKKNSFVIIIGKKNHPETTSHQSYSESNYVIENISDIKASYQVFLSSGKKDVYVVAQTTFNEEAFDEIVSGIKKIFHNINLEVDKTICNATSIRQKETHEIASKVDKMIVIGGKKSSNTKELAVEACKCCKEVYLIQTKDDLDKDMFTMNDVVGITAGASTPYEVIEEIVEYLRNLYKKVK